MSGPSHSWARRSQRWAEHMLVSDSQASVPGVEEVRSAYRVQGRTVGEQTIRRLWSPAGMSKPIPGVPPRVHDRTSGHGAEKKLNIPPKIKTEMEDSNLF